MNNNILCNCCLICIVHLNPRAERHATTEEAVQERVSRVRSSEKKGRGKDQDQTVVMRATTPHGTLAPSAADSRSTWRQRIPPLVALAKVLALGEVSPIILGNTHMNHLQIIKPPRDNNASVLPPRMRQTSMNLSSLTRVSLNWIPCRTNQVRCLCSVGRPYTYPLGFQRHHKIKNQSSFRC